ncbi:MAG: isoaspartyl peptidase/L-asparaginase, partial [Candidatus Marinimicrobia bacterium]|nr:isoaspartyl peptidase/L-asparaginase [Candidatus Neomarinimicrobiota bacterium]
MTTLIPKLIIHGGAGNLTLSTNRIKKFHNSLQKIVDQTYDVLCDSNARKAVLHGVRMLEDDPLFNAGTGSKLQIDGIARMSASIMDSSNLLFSGVINVQDIQHPIDLADKLSSGKYRVLAGDFATKYAHQNGFPFYDPITEERKTEFEKKIAGETGTVGVVALDKNGVICAGTSTGGVGMEITGRVSDCPTIAGNYVSDFAGVSVTGIGEDIIDLSVASRIVILVEAGMSLHKAVSVTLEAGKKRNSQFGVIAIDLRGNL